MPRNILLSHNNKNYAKLHGIDGFQVLQVDCTSLVKTWARDKSQPKRGYNTYIATYQSALIVVRKHQIL